MSSKFCVPKIIKTGLFSTQVMQKSQLCKSNGRVEFFKTQCNNVIICLQCFDAVGWAAGRASGL